MRTRAPAPSACGASRNDAALILAARGENATTQTGRGTRSRPELLEWRPAMTLIAPSPTDCRLAALEQIAANLRRKMPASPLLIEIERKIERRKPLRMPPPLAPPRRNNFKGRGKSPI